LSTNADFPCQVAVTPLGWWLTFPNDPKAGLLLASDSERADFRAACDLESSGDLDNEAFDPTEIATCPIEYYVRARHFTSPGW
jgi:hypothetical protein